MTTTTAPAWTPAPLDVDHGASGCTTDVVTPAGIAVDAWLDDLGYRIDSASVYGRPGGIGASLSVHGGTSDRGPLTARVHHAERLTRPRASTYGVALGDPDSGDELILFTEDRAALAAALRAAAAILDGIDPLDA